MKFQCKLASAAIAATILAAAASANADMLVSESFTHPNGNLVGQTPEIGGTWAAHSSAGTGPIQVTGDQAAVLQHTADNEDDNVPFANGYVAGAGSVLYAAFDLDVPSASVTAPLTPEYFAAFLQGTSNYTSRLWIEAPGTSGFRLALANGSTAPSAGSSSDLAFDTTYRIVTSYDYTNMVGSLWIDPVDQSSASLAGTGTGFSDASTAFALRQATPPSGFSEESIDNLDVATTFNEALTGVAAPEPASLSLLAIGGLALLARRRK